jgi:hypothetical protein
MEKERSKSESSGKGVEKPQPPVWLADAQDAVGHPNSVDIEILKHQISELFTN